MADPLVVVKVGGGLERVGGAAALRACCAAIAVAARGRRVIVLPGGSAFADAVREADATYELGERRAHEMALLAMDQFGHLLAGLLDAPTTDEVATSAGWREAPAAERRAAAVAGGRGAVGGGGAAVAEARGASGGGVRVLLPARWASAATAAGAMPASWAVTSDSVAALVAAELGAELLVLVKAVAGLIDPWPGGRPLDTLDARELTALQRRGGGGAVDPWFATALGRYGRDAWLVDGRDPERVSALITGGSAAGTRLRPARPGAG